jgi:hypothetical protein
MRVNSGGGIHRLHLGPYASRSDAEKWLSGSGPTSVSGRPSSPAKKQSGQVDLGDDDVASPLILQRSETHHPGHGDAATVRVEGAIRIEGQELLPFESLALVGDREGDRGCLRSARTMAKRPRTAAGRGGA